MPSDLLSSLSTVTPALSILSIRPKINNEGQSQSPISTHTASFSSNHASNSPIYSIPMGSIGTPSSSPLEIQSLQPSTIKEEVEGQPHSSLNVRSDLIGIHSFPCLRELYLSNLSMEGARNLTMALPYLPHLEHVTLDFTFVEDSLLCNLKEACMNLKTLRIRTTGTKVSFRCRQTTDGLRTHFFSNTDFIVKHPLEGDSNPFFILFILSHHPLLL